MVFIVMYIETYMHTEYETSKTVCKWLGLFNLHSSIRTYVHIYVP